MGLVHKIVNQTDPDTARISWRSTKANVDKGFRIMSVTLFHRAADSIGTLFILLMGLATGGAMAIVGI
jgi:hypothetical protein